MFCYQCEQTAKGVGCTVSGVCGKNPEVAGLQDLLIHACKGLSMYAAQARKLGVKDHEADIFTIEALFATLTNVNFDPVALRGMIGKAVKVRQRV
jgi:hydroxylamine reductase